MTEAFKKILENTKKEYDEWRKRGTKEVTPDLIRSVRAPIIILSEFMRSIIPGDDEP